MAQPAWILLAFLSPTCPHCMKQYPLLQKLANDRPDVSVQVIDVTIDRLATEQWGVSTVPTLFICGYRPVGQPALVHEKLSGFTPLDVLKAKMKSIP